MSDAILHLDDIDLTRDPASDRFQKAEAVSVIFASAAGSLDSLEGPNTICEGDAIVQAEAGERWVVSRERFTAKYEPAGMHAMGEDGPYRNMPTPVWAKTFDHRFSIARCAGGDRLSGEAGDWLLQYAPGDYGIVQQARFAKVYRRLID